jgi:N-acetylneuraminic acid mutarotase
VATLALDGRVYVIGGLGTGDAGVKVEAYDPASDSWRAVAPLPQPIHHPAAVALAGKIYVIGGFRDGFMPLNDVHEYDPASDAWRRRAPLPTPRGALGAAVIEGKIYAVGGVTIGGDNTGATEVYDPATDRWQVRAPMAVPRNHMAVAAVGGKLCAIGGRLRLNFPFGGEGADRTLAENEVYDPATDTWQSAPPMPGAATGWAPRRWAAPFTSPPAGWCPVAARPATATRRSPPE